MPVFRKKPVEIEAVQFTGDFSVIREFVGPDNLITAVISNDPRIDGQVWDRLHSTWVGFGNGDWIIEGVRGGFYPCEEGVFADTYEPVCTACGEPADSVTVADDGVERWCPDCLDAADTDGGD